MTDRKIAMQVQMNQVTIELVTGDITQQQVDAIVNAANRQLAGGGGVDGAIHRAGGPSIMQETDRNYPDGWPTGSAVLSGAGKLPARFVIHAVGPIWNDGQQGEPEQLASAHRRCLELAVEHGCTSIAFPALSTGAFGYPVHMAARTALQEVIRFLKTESDAAGGPPLKLVRFVLFNENVHAEFAEVLAELSSDW